MEFFPRTVEPKATAVEVIRPRRREIVRQLRPGATRSAQVQGRVNHLAQIDATRAPARLGRWNRRLDQSPLLVRQV